MKNPSVHKKMPYIFYIVKPKKLQIVHRYLPITFKNSLYSQGINVKTSNYLKVLIFRYFYKELLPA